MALDLEQIRNTAERVAASHGLEVVELDYHGAGKQRALRVFIEKTAAERARMAQLARDGDVQALEDFGGEGALALIEKDQLAGVTHTDCEQFSYDFGTVLDVEELVPGNEYTLEVSSPGLDRKLSRRSDFERFAGSLVKLQTREPVNGNRHWQGRLLRVEGEMLHLDLSAMKQPRKKGSKAPKAKLGEEKRETVEIAVGNLEKANLVAEI